MDSTLTKTIKNAVAALTIVLLLVGVFMVIKIANGFHVIDENNYNTITVNGDAESFAAPDIATVSFSVRAEDMDLVKAQAAAEKSASVAIDAVKSFGVDAKDIQTTYYNATPMYDYNQKCGVYGCESGDRVLKGYEVNETVTIKIRDLAKVSNIIGLLGTAKVTDIQGPNFDIENRDALMQDARTEAIKEAKAKAKVLANELGVNLGRVVSYYDNNGYGGPIMYAKSEMEMDSMAGAPTPASNPTIEQGQNRIYSSVSIVYKIR